MDNVKITFITVLQHYALHDKTRQEHCCTQYHNKPHQSMQDDGSIASISIAEPRRSIQGNEGSDINHNDRT